MSACRAPVAAQARTSRIAFRFEARLCAASCASAACLLGIPSVLPVQAASPPKRARALEAAPRGRDLLKLAHCRTDSSPIPQIRT